MSQFLAHILVRKLASKRSKRLVDGVRAKLSPFSPRFTKREVRVQQERAASARSRLLLSDDSHPSRTYVKAFGISKKRCFEQALHDTTVIMRVTFVPMCALAQRVGPFCAHFWCAFWPKMGPKTGPVFGTRIATQKWDQTFQNVLFVHPGGNQIRYQKLAPVWVQKLAPGASFLCNLVGNFSNHWTCGPRTAMQRRSSFCLPGVGKTVRNDKLPADSNHAPTIPRR